MSRSCHNHHRYGNERLVAGREERRTGELETGSPRAADVAPSALRRLAIRWPVILLSMVLCPHYGVAQVTERVDLGPGGTEGNGAADLPWPPSSVISADGRFVAFMSASNNLVSVDTNQTWDVFVRDRLAGVTELMSVDTSGAQANGVSGLYGITITPDGRYVAFESAASNLVPGDTNGVRDVFLHDRTTGVTERVSLDSHGAQGNASSMYPELSSDGRFVAFMSQASNLVAGDTNAASDVFIRDRLTSVTERVSLSTTNVQGNDYSTKPAISSNGRFVAYESLANNLTAGDTNGALDIFIRDRQYQTTTRLSVASNGAQGNGHSTQAVISASGRIVSFTSTASNLVGGDTNGVVDVFVRDSQAGTTERMSVSTAGVQGNGMSTGSTLSEDGRCVAFESASNNLTAGDTGAFDVFVRDRSLGTTERISVSTAGSQANGDSEMGSISASGRFVVFRSLASNLVPADTNAYSDVFVHDRFSCGFSSTCDPGINNVIPCPCGNPPSGSGRGCDNSSFSGGASLSASGISYLSMDSLVLSTAGERSTATSILLEGDAWIPGGQVFGQGVRCAGGNLRRLYVKPAIAGSTSMPDFNAGDPSISVRSAQVGAPIQPGQSYSFLVYYRDPVILGGCPATSTFNGTQTGLVAYWP